MEITIKNGVFTGVSGAVKSFSPTRLIGMGWLVQINEDGTLDAQCQKKINNGRLSLKVMIKKGSFIVTKKIFFDNGGCNNLKKYERKIADGTISGILGLSTDQDVEDRYAYFKEEAEILFRKAYAINKITNTDPNQVYSLHINDSVHTDGKVRKTITGKANCYIDVEDATWVLIETSGENKERLLYTLVQYNKLSLPKMLSVSGRVEVVKELQKEFSSLDEVMEYVESKFNLARKNVYSVKENVYDADETKFKALYYLDADGFIKMSILKLYIWNGRDSVEKAKVEEEFVKENKDNFTVTEVVLEAIACLK